MKNRRARWVAGVGVIVTLVAAGGCAPLVVRAMVEARARCDRYAAQPGAG
ncbi:MAG: hypothetical protein U5L03_15195 [Burkholderiaceae bacterium]|nr:hypothetical protein [Burkholderiaceae bacterium]